MKIIAINGSYRGKTGYSHFLIQTLFKGAEKQGAKCEEVFLSEKEIIPCRGSFCCEEKNNYLKCILKDDTEEIFNTMRSADLIILATPVYLMGMSGIMKVFLDRIFSTSDCKAITMTSKGYFFHHIDKELCGKPFVSIVCQDNLEKEMNKSILRWFKSWSRFTDAPHAGTIIRRWGAFSGHGNNREKEMRFPAIKKCYKAIEKAGEELVLTGKISTRTQRAACRDITPFPLFKFLIRFKPIKKKLFQKAGKRILNQEGLTTLNEVS